MTRRQVYTPDHLESSLKKAAAMLVAEEYRLLVVDSIIAPFRFEYCGCAAGQDLRRFGFTTPRKLARGLETRPGQRLVDEASSTPPLPQPNVHTITTATQRPTAKPPPHTRL